MKPLLAVLMTVAMLVAALPADASRNPTRAERSAILRAAKTSAKCSLIRVSTVKDRYQWAAVRRLQTEACTGSSRPASNCCSRVFRRKAGGTWRFVTARPPVCDSDEPVPAKVARDLKLGCVIPGRTT